MQTQEAFLRSLGLLDPDTPLADLEAAKAEYQKAKKKVLAKQYRKTHARIEFYVPFEERDLLKAESSERGLKTGQFVRYVLKSHRAQQSLLPDVAHVHDMTMQVQRIGNNINQVVKKLHEMRIHPADAVEVMHDQIRELQGVVHKYCTQYKYPSIEQFFEHGTSHDPAFLENVRAVFFQYLPRTHS